MRANAMEVALVVPSGAAEGPDCFLRLFRTAQFTAASLSAAAGLTETLPLEKGLLALAEAGQVGNYNPTSEGLRRRGSRWAVEGWRAISAPDDSPELRETLSRIRYNKIPVISPHDLLATMLADSDVRDRMFIEAVSRALTRPRR